jgi:ketosteroid isomerase-like protein
MPASTPQEIHALFERAFNLGDIEAMLALYEPGAVLVAGGRPVTGHDGIREALSLFVASGRGMKLETRMIIESGEGLALLHGAWSLGPSSERRGLSTEVVRRQSDGSWLFVFDNPNTPL